MRNSKIEKLLAKGENKLTDNERESLKKELKEYQIKNVPIYAYVKGNEICFRIVFNVLKIFTRAGNYKDFSGSYMRSSRSPDMTIMMMHMMITGI